ncbi:hypothetical protein [Halochromatium roseum]|uniref:hypothetical protein n=1 Tax=Halochromatium roseum TaxID=391920 RepID=UPI0019145914|nr:hypothetical protein [Halochromatium roseum]MBK5939982.1 hypothetical protein [Halochromatium roseum]
MPKRIPEEELNAILAIVADHHPSAVQVRAIRDGLASELPTRMLQRRLALLVDRQRLTAEGRGKGRRYRLPPNNVGVQARPGQLEIKGHPAGLEVYPPVSPEAMAIKDAVRAPIQHRQPVGYQQAFLDDYRPNETFYLPEDTRQRLLEMGRPPDAERPAGTYARRIYSRLLIDLS